VPTRPTSRRYRDIDKKLVEGLIKAARDNERSGIGLMGHHIGIKPKPAKKDPDVPQWKYNLKNQNPD
jgi:hypothetical protein